MSSVVAPPPASQGRRAAVVALGDLGRSPRMQYHALALANAGMDVDLIGFAGSEPFPAVRAERRIRLCALADRDRAGDGPGFARRAGRRAARQAVALLRQLLGERKGYHVAVVQTPPAIPTLAAAWIAARTRGTRLVVDWHNLTSAMLALRLGPTDRLVRLSAAYERAVGRRADAHLCVSAAMQRALAERWGISAVVLYDRPAAHFAPLGRDARDDVVRRLCARLDWRPEGRPALLVCPSSWSDDDDFELLLDALPRLDARLANADGPAVLLLLTGSGPRRERTAPRLTATRGRRVRTEALWLAAEEYPSVLAAADLGISVHRSASGLDLPMKIADLFGAGVPVCQLDYSPVLAEVLRPGTNALLFSTAAELAAAIDSALAGFPFAAHALDRLRAGVAAAAPAHWDEEWRRVAIAAVLPPR